MHDVVCSDTRHLVTSVDIFPNNSDDLAVCGYSRCAVAIAIF